MLRVVAEKVDFSTCGLHVVSKQDDAGRTPQVGQIDSLIPAVVAVVDDVTAKAFPVPPVNNIKPQADSLIMVQFVVFALDCAMLYPELAGCRGFYIVSVGFPPAAITGINCVRPRCQFVGVVYCYDLALPLDKLNVLRCKAGACGDAEICCAGSRFFLFSLGGVTFVSYGSATPMPIRNRASFGS